MTKKSKMLLTLLLALVMVVTTACSGSEDVKAPASVNGDSSVTSNNESADSSSGNKTEDNVVAEITVAETVLYDVDGVKVTATGYEEGWTGPEIKILVENNSDKNVLITSDSVSVNSSLGYIIPKDFRQWVEIFLGYLFIKIWIDHTNRALSCLTICIIRLKLTCVS